MAGITDRKINTRNQVLWFPSGGYDTSTGDSTLSQDLNALNSGTASLQRSIEGLDQRWKDIGIDPSSVTSGGVSTYITPSNPLINCSSVNTESVLHTYDNGLQIIWNDSSGSAQSLSGSGTSANNAIPVSGAKWVGKIGINSSKYPLRVVCNGVPAVHSGSDLFVSSLATNGLGFVITNNIISNPTATSQDAFCFVTASPVTGGGITLKGYFLENWKTLDELHLLSIFAPNEVCIFSFKWASTIYTNTYFFSEQEVATANQTGNPMGQIVLGDYRDMQNPHRTHPQLFYPRGTVLLYFAHDGYDNFLVFFDITTTAAGYSVAGQYVGKKGMAWEGWRVMGVFGNCVDMSGRFPRGWDRTLEDSSNTDLYTTGSEIRQLGSGTESSFTSVPVPNIAYTDANGNAVDPGATGTEKLSVNTTGGTPGDVASTTHSHEVNMIPKYQTFVYLIKT